MDQTIQLKYGDGFTGRNYYMLFEGKPFYLLDCAGGSPNDANHAREFAKSLLREKGVDDQVIDKMPFTWDGTM